tara:strand:+ start:36 stop:539 length:504 start_codon:yes stop_codon:yes gene_type:complete
MSSSFFDTSKYVDLDFGNKFNLFNKGNSFNTSTNNSPSFADVYKSGVADSFAKDSTKSKGFLDKFIGGMDSYLGTQKKSDTDKYLDFLREQKGKAQFGSGTGGFASEVAEGLNIYQPPSPNQQMFIPGQEGKGGFNPLGAVVGGIRGFAGGGGPIGAIGGALGGGFM